MHVLLTNDDGYESPGLAAIRDALITSGQNVTVVAPDGNRSATGHSITPRPALELKRHTKSGDPNPIYSCSGKPADCARIGILNEELWEPVDLVVSGINIGINLGDDVNYSGTVSAAAEASLLGTAAIAFSQQPVTGGAPFINHSGHDFNYVEYAARLAVAVSRTPAPDRLFANVNLPHRAEHEAATITRLGRRHYKALINAVETADGQWNVSPWATADFPEPSFDETPDVDFGAVVRGRVSFTPMHASRSAALPDEYREWATAVLDDAGLVTADSTYA